MGRYDVKIINQLKEGDKVKIDIEKYRWQREQGSLTDAFWQFLEDNKETIFTLFARNKYGIIWGIEEDTRWSLYGDFLIKVD
jgi:hypothetical protein